MSVYKEGYCAVEAVQKASRQIYPDAADYGAPVKLGDELCQMVKGAMHFYGEPESRKVERYATGVTVTQDIELIDEWGSKQEERFRFCYTSAGKRDAFDGYISVERVPIPA